jgi:hypothetical protein
MTVAQLIKSFTLWEFVKAHALTLSLRLPLSGERAKIRWSSVGMTTRFLA